MSITLLKLWNSVARQYSPRQIPQVVSIARNVSSRRCTLTLKAKVEVEGVDMLKKTTKGKLKEKGQGKRNTTVPPTPADDPVSPVNLIKKKNCIFINVVAKPGAKTNCVTGIDSEGVSVQIAAPPVDGEANTELIKFFSIILGVKKSFIDLEKGHKSRNKTLSVQTESTLSVEDVLGKLQSQIP